MFNWRKKTGIVKLMPLIELDIGIYTVGSPNKHCLKENLGPVYSSYLYNERQHQQREGWSRRRGSGERTVWLGPPASTAILKAI